MGQRRGKSQSHRNRSGCETRFQKTRPVLARLPHTDIKGATIVAERVCAAVNRNIKLTFDKKNVRITASVGVAALHDGNLENLLNVADGVMYSAKRAGRNQVAVESAEAY